LEKLAEFSIRPQKISKILQNLENARRKSKKLAGKSEILQNFENTRRKSENLAEK